jgi:hypothetical protein
MTAENLLPARRPHKLPFPHGHRRQVATGRRPARKAFPLAHCAAGLTVYFLSIRYLACTPQHLPIRALSGYAHLYSPTLAILESFGAHASATLAKPRCSAPMVSASGAG